MFSSYKSAFPALSFCLNFFLKKRKQFCFVLLVKFVIISQIKFWKEVVSVSEEFEKCVADLKRNIKQSLKKNDTHFAERMQKKNFLRYKN